MILYEYEGKNILSKYGIKVPKSQLILSSNDKVLINTPLVVKSQVLSGKRMSAGGIVFVENKENIEDVIKSLIGKKINKEKTEKVLLEEKVNSKNEYYLSISYEGDLRSPIVSFSNTGGSGIEDRNLETFPVDILTLEIDYKKNSSVPQEIKAFINKLLEIFISEDATLLEINPVVITDNDQIIALDAKIKLDDNALGKYPYRTFSPRSVPGYTASQNEIDAKKIDEGDHRGTAGSAYFDLDGDIAILASGGGASLTAMDALLKAGGKPANYTEYSGNPPKEKVEKLSNIVLGKKGINGLWVVGAIANFTNIYQTLSGFLEALKKLNPRPKFPIVIRRGGPQDKEAFDMLRKEKDFDFHLYGQEISITKSAGIMVDLAKKYASTTK